MPFGNYTPVISVTIQIQNRQNTAGLFSLCGSYKHNSVPSRPPVSIMPEREAQVGIKDQELLEYLRDNERCADLMNGTIFHGMQVVQAEYLRRVPRKKTIFPDSCSQRRNGKLKRNSSDAALEYVERERDIILLHDEPGERFYIACEGESQPDYEMPVRCFTYDAVEYSEQIRLGENKGIRREGSSKQLIPVFHQVLYLGEKRWLSKHTLREMMDIPLKLSQYDTLLPDYKIHLADIHEQNPEFFRTEWRDIFRLMNHSRKKEELKRYIEQHREEIRRLSIETRRFLAVLLDQYEIIDNGRVEVKDVCDAWDGAMMMYKEEGRESGLLEGRKSGIIEGRKSGLAEGRELGIKALILDNVEEGKGKETILTKLERRFSLSSEEAELYFSQFANDSLFPNV